MPGSERITSSTRSIWGFMLTSTHSEPASVSVLRAPSSTRRPALLTKSRPARSNTTCFGAAARIGASACSARGEDAVSSLPVRLTTVVSRTRMVSDIAAPSLGPPSRPRAGAPALEDEAILPVLAHVFHTVHQLADQVHAQPPAPVRRPGPGPRGIQRVEGGSPVRDLEPHHAAQQL